MIIIYFSICPIIFLTLCALQLLSFGLNMLSAYSATQTVFLLYLPLYSLKN